MPKKRFDVIIAGAGISGVAISHYLRLALPNISIGLIDPNLPVSQTSSMSTEAYRNYWTTKNMRDLMNRSIDLLENIEEEKENRIHLSRNGYAYITNTNEGSESMISTLLKNENGNEKNIRRHNQTKNVNEILKNSFADVKNWRDVPQGFDIFEDGNAAKYVWPFLSAENVKTVLWARRCGWCSAQQLGMVFYENGVKNHAQSSFIQGTIVNVELNNSNVQNVSVVNAKSSSVDVYECGRFVNAAGPWINSIQKLLPSTIQIPFRNELHAKCILKDVNNIIPRSSPLVILNDEVDLNYDDDEIEFIMKETGIPVSALKGKLPGGAHFRPYGKDSILLLWEHVHHHVKVKDPPNFDFTDLFIPFKTELAIRALKEVIPGFESYPAAKTFIDGGYYTKTPENIPVVGKLPNLSNAFICGGLSGYGIMASNAVGEIATKLILETSDLPTYASMLSPSRYLDKEYLQNLEKGTVDGENNSSL